MTVAATLTQKQYTGTGTSAQFSFPNKIFSAGDLVIAIYDTSGNAYPFVNFANATLGWTYSVQNVDVDTGCIVVLSNVLTSGWVLDIRSLIPELQSTSVKNQGQFLPELHEEAFDRGTRLIQDLLRLTYTFGIHGPDTEFTPWPALPTASLRKGYALMFDAITGLPELGFLSAQNVTQGLIIPLLNPQTPAEATALVTPVNFYYPECTVERYGNNTTPTITDMTSAVQNCVNVCKQYSPWKDLTVSTQCLLTSPVNIDRLHDLIGNDDYFRIKRLGNGGFYVNSAIPMFSTTLAFSAAPVSQMILFDGLAFTSGNSALAAYVLDNAKFLRVQFSRCDFDFIKLLSAPTVFTQSIYVFDSNIRRFTGIFFDSENVTFDCRFERNILEAADRYLRMAFPVGCVVRGLIEGCSGTAIRAWGSQGLEIHAYFEQNDVDGDFTPIASESSYGIKLSGFSSHTPIGGAVLTVSGLTGGSAYTNGTYTNVPLTGGNGFGAQGTVVVAGGAVTSLTITAQGLGYLVSDVLSAAAASIGGTGSGFTDTVATISAGYNPSSTYSFKWGNCFNCNAEAMYGSWALHNLGAGSQVRIDGFAVQKLTNSPGIYGRPPYNSPVFSAYNNASQSIVTTTFTKALFQVIDFDTNANFANGTFTPTVAGYYSIEGVIKAAGTGISRFAVAVYKNGTEFARLVDFNFASTISGWTQPVVSSGVSMNGTTDFLELWVFIIATTPSIASNAATDASRFSARYLRNNS